MLRGDGIICGTSTTGTGTLTLAATPVPPGGVDLDVAARAFGLGNNAAIPCGYTLIEYTDSSFGAESKREKGTGVLTLGGSSGIANCTLTRANIDHTATNLNSQPATWNASPGTGVSIGTAANTLIFISPSVSELRAASAYSNADATTLSRDGVGVSNIQGATSINGAAVNQRIYFILFDIAVRRSITKARVRISGTYSGQNNNVYCAIYALNSSAHPGKLLADFGPLGTPNQAFGSSGYIASAALSTPLILYPGFYIGAIHPIWTVGGSGTPGLRHSPGINAPFTQQLWGNSDTPVQFLQTESNANTAFDDPAVSVGGMQNTASFNLPMMWLGN